MNYIYLKCGAFPQREKGVLLMEEQCGESSLEEMSLHVTEQQALAPCQNETFVSRQEFYLSSRFWTECGNIRTRSVINTQWVIIKLWSLYGEIESAGKREGIEH